MITEDYVSFETAQLLKEKGFEGRMHTFYTEQGTEMESAYVVPSNFFPIYRPTLQMVMKWLRKEHNIAISIYVFNRDMPVQEGNIIYTCDIATINKTSKEGHLRLTGPYEEVCEVAIKYCLENLI